MALKPLFENNASPEVKEQYALIRNTLNLPSIPLFFAYIGPFPKYLEFLTEQVVTNANDHRFNDLSLETKNLITPLASEVFVLSEERAKWLNLYKYSPSFYHFEKTLDDLFLTNIKIAFFFIGIREAIKGWAVAAKKLPSTTTSQPSSTPHEEGTFIFEMSDILPQQKNSSTQESSITSSQTSGLTLRYSPLPEKDLLQEYLLICQHDFRQHMKKESFLHLRVALEKIFLSSLPLLPHPINSPINQVIQLTRDYPDFPDLLYLLSEHFPTYSMQRMMFSGFMRKEML